MYVQFWPPGARKTAETARFRPSVRKTELTAAKPPKFRSFHPLELFGFIQKRLGHDLFFAENQFSPVFTRRQVRVHGASGTKLPAPKHASWIKMALARRPRVVNDTALLILSMLLGNRLLSNRADSCNFSNWFKTHTKVAYA